MQYTSVELYNETSIKNDIPLHKVKFVGDIVFSALNSQLNKPEAIILKIKNIGKFYMRKNKLDGEIGFLTEFVKKEDVDPKYQIKLDNLLKRQKEYEEYLEEKKKIKKIRHENQSIVQSPVQEEDF